MRTGPSLGKGEEIVLYLDVWGCSSRRMDSSEINEPYASQEHFSTILCGLAEALPEITVEHTGDIAYVYSQSLEKILAFAFAAFKRMTLDQDRFDLRTLRGGIARGAIPRESLSPHQKPINSVSNIRTSTRIGPGLVEAARLEKSCQRGMRLFLAKDLGGEAQSSRRFPVRLNHTKGVEHWEACWLAPDPLHSDYLQTKINERSVRDLLIDRSRELIDTADNSAQQLGASLTDLLRWWDKESHEVDN